MGNQVKAYWSKEIAMELDISTSTLRKWSLALEREGYTFIRDENDRRAYILSDLDVFKQMQKLIHNGVSVEDASNAVAVRYLSDSSDQRTLAVRQKNNDEERSHAYLELLTQNQEMKTLLERLEQTVHQQTASLTQEIINQREYIEESLKRRDEQMLIALREMSEQRKQAASAKKWWKFRK